MTAFYLVTCIFLVLLVNHVYCQSTANAQSICDSMGIVGMYPNPVDTTCKQYAKCFRSNSVLTGAFYNCSGLTIFNPKMQSCTTTYTCTVTTATTPTPTTAITEETTSTTTSAPISAQSICDSEGIVGRYPNPEDTTCQQYAYCFTRNGSIAGSFYNCTGITLFDPSQKLCSNGYKCNA